MAVQAQRVLGPFPDATVLPRGVARIGFEPTWGTAAERFADGTRGAAAGEREPLAADFDREALTAEAFEPLRPVARVLESITGDPSLPVSLGRLQVVFDQSVATIPISLDYGVTRRLTLGVMVPYVQARNEVYANPNPGRNEGTIGLNPARAFAGARAANGMVVTQLGEAATRLQARLEGCVGSTAPECTAVNADRAGATQLAARAASIASGIAALYGTTTVTGSRFAPVDRSLAHRAVEARLGTLSTAFTGFLGAPGTRGGWVEAQPVGAPPISYTDLQTLLTEQEYGIVGLPFQTVEIRQMGDVEVGGKFLLFDSFGAAVPQRIDPGGIKLRVALGALYRFGAGTFDRADDFADIQTGDGQDDIEGRLFADVLVGRRFWASMTARYGVQRADAQFRRIPSTPGEPFPAGYRQLGVARDLGDFMALDVTPRWTLGDALMASASYQYFRKGEDSYTGVIETTDLEGNLVTLDAALLNPGTERTAQRLLGALTYSTMAAYYRGQASLPLEVSYTFGQTTAGSGLVARERTHAIGVRVYARLFGGADSRPARPPRR